MKTVILMILRLHIGIPKLLYYIYGNLRKVKTKPLLQRNRDIQWVIKKILKAGHTTLVVKGLEHIPKAEGYVIYGNHQSNFDPLIILSQVEGKLSVVAKTQLSRVPVLSAAVKSIDGLFMDRDDIKQSVRIIKEVSKRVAEEKMGYIIFPEGTRSLSETMQPFKAGAFKAAFKAKAAIVPTCVHNAYTIMEKPVNNPVVYLTFLPSLSYDEYKTMSSAELADKVQAMIQNELNLILEKVHQA